MLINASPQLRRAIWLRTASYYPCAALHLWGDNVIYIRPYILPERWRSLCLCQ